MDITIRERENISNARDVAARASMLRTFRVDLIREGVNTQLWRINGSCNNKKLGLNDYEGSDKSKES